MIDSTSNCPADTSKQIQEQMFNRISVIVYNVTIAETILMPGMEDSKLHIFLEQLKIYSTHLFALVLLMVLMTG